MAKKLNFNDFAPNEATIKEATDITKQKPSSIAYKTLKPAFIASYINSVFGILSMIVAYYSKQITIESVLPKWLVESEIAVFALLAILGINLIIIFARCGLDNSITVLGHIYSVATLLPFPLSVLGFVFITPFVIMLILGLPTIFVLLVFWCMVVELKRDANTRQTTEYVENIDLIQK